MDEQLKQRWRLVLGRYANALDTRLSSRQQQQDEVLQQLYQEGQLQRGFKVSAGLGESELAVTNWLEAAETLFPRSVNDRLQSDAVERFGLHQVLEQPQVLEKITPSMGVLKQLLKLNAHHKPAIRQQVERIIQGVVEELLRRLRPTYINNLSGRLNRQAHSPVKRLPNLDWQTSIRRNLKHFDGEKVCFERVYFHARQQYQLPWHIVLCIDQSGSMATSLIYSAVIAGILTRLPSVKLSLVVFDTQVVDLSEQAQDPVSVLLNCQLGGGTLISQAWRYCQQLCSEPGRSVVATVSDFEEGGSMQALLAQAQGMIDSGIKMLGMTAMNHDAEPFYSTFSTDNLQRLGMEIGSLSPDNFAEWLALTMGLRR
ncbi:VWA domain-containing protein [Shewanella algae]|uniref:VWA domain-containing protein n=1 Tax=Shewanella algae TaxID=38313 RepID=UPI00313CF4FD